MAVRNAMLLQALAKGIGPAAGSAWIKEHARAINQLWEGPRGLRYIELLALGVSNLYQEPSVDDIPVREYDWALDPTTALCDPAIHASSLRDRCNALGSLSNAEPSSFDAAESAYRSWWLARLREIPPCRKCGRSEHWFES